METIVANQCAQLARCWPLASMALPGFGTLGSITSQGMCRIFNTALGPHHARLVAPTTFVDLGCGDGWMLALALLAGYHSALGFDNQLPSLSEIPHRLHHVCSRYSYMSPILLQQGVCRGVLLDLTLLRPADIQQTHTVCTVACFVGAMPVELRTHLMNVLTECRNVTTIIWIGRRLHCQEIRERFSSWRSQNLRNLRMRGSGEAMHSEILFCPSI